MRLSAEIETVFSDEATDSVSVREILDRVSHRSFGVLLVILALPSALPMPAPGYSVPFGIALLFLGFQMIRLREYPWFPDRVLDKRIGTKGRAGIVGAMVRFLGMFEKLVRPRLSFVYRNKLLYRGMGSLILLCALSMCIPIPLTNTTPAMGIFLIGLGALEEDGLAGIAGVFVAITGLALSLTVLGLILYFGMEAVDMVKDFIKGAMKDPIVLAAVSVGALLVLVGGGVWAMRRGRQ